MNFSVVLIARNEAETLPRLVNSLESFRAKGGEIVLVDTGSTDGTAEVARQLGCKVTEVGDRFRLKITDVDAINGQLEADELPVVKAGDSLFDYSSARNFAASLASNDVVAMPDCDEIYTKFDLEAVESAIASGAEQLEYEFVFSHDQYGRPAIAFRHCKFYNRTKLKWTGIIHEVLTGNAKRVYLPESVIKLEHYQNEKTDRSGYLRGLALDVYLHPENDRHIHYYARELYWTGRPKSAVEFFKKHLEMNGWITERSQSCIYLGDITGDINWYHMAYKLEQGRRVPFIRLAEFYRRHENPARVIAYAEAALTIPHGNFYSDEAAHYKEVPHMLLYWAYWYAGNQEKSKEHYLKAKAFAPLNPQILHDTRFYEELPRVTVVLPQLGRPEGFKRAVESVNRLIYPPDKLELLIEDGPDTVPNKVDRMYKAAKGDYVVFAANDIEFTPESLMIALNESRKTGKELVAFNTGKVTPDEGNICEHFLIKKTLVQRIGGQIFDTDFWHVGVDNLLWAQCKKLNQAHRSEDAIVHHYHFSTGKADNDEVYKKGWSRTQADRELLAKKLKELYAR